jgi:hypothetical protein
VGIFESFGAVLSGLAALFAADFRVFFGVFDQIVGSSGSIDLFGQFRAIIDNFIEQQCRSLAAYLAVERPNSFKSARLIHHQRPALVLVFDRHNFFLTNQAS